MNLTTEQIYCILALSGFFVACLGTIIATAALIKVLAMERSTHSIQFQPMPFDSATDQENESFLDKWATSDRTLKEQGELYTDDIKSSMPEFSTTDDDKEVISF